MSVALFGVMTAVVHSMTNIGSQNMFVACYNAGPCVCFDVKSLRSRNLSRRLFPTRARVSTAPDLLEQQPCEETLPADNVDRASLSQLFSRGVGRDFRTLNFLFLCVATAHSPHTPFSESTVANRMVVMPITRTQIAGLSVPKLLLYRILRKTRVSL